MSVDFALGRSCREAARARGMSQADVATALGVKRGAVPNLYSGARRWHVGDVGRGRFSGLLSVELLREQVGYTPGGGEPPDLSGVDAEGEDWPRELLMAARAASGLGPGSWGSYFGIDAATVVGIESKRRRGSSLTTYHFRDVCRAVATGFARRCDVLRLLGLPLD